MTFYTFTRTDGPGPWDYPTLGFSAVNGAVLDGSLFTPALVDPPDAFWAVGGSTESGVTRWGALISPPGPAEPATGSVLVYDAVTNQSAWVEGVDAFASGTSLGDALSARFATEVNAASPQYGMSPAASGSANATALTAAIAAVSSGGAVIIPAGTYAITGDITITGDSVVLRGTGDATVLNFTNGGLIIDGSVGYTMETGLHDLRLSRVGTAGPALYYKGAGSGTGAAHFNASNIRVFGSTGEGLLVGGAYIGTFTGCYWIDCATGIKIINALGVYGNNLSFFGGETQACDVGVSLDSPIGVNFYGHAIEGNNVSGVDVFGDANGVGFYGCYFEQNVGWDIRLGNSAGLFIGPIGFIVTGCYFADGSANKNNAITLIRGVGIEIRGNSFAGYTLEPIDVLEAAAGLVEGEARNNRRGTTSLPTVALNGATRFNRTIVGRESGTPIYQHYAIASTTLDFPGIAAGATSELTVTVAGAAPGDDATAHPNSSPEAGLVWTATVTATDTVTVRLANVTTGIINPVARGWRVRVWR